MLSRVANSIYWMNRYLERADNIARFIQVNDHLMLDLGLEQENSRWQPLLYASGDHEDFFQRYPSAIERHVLKFLTFDEKNPNSILSCLRYARENARTIRENIPSEMWESINELFHLSQRYRRKRRIDGLGAFYEAIQSFGYLINAYSLDLMVHGEAWHFARMGRMLERSDKTARLMDIKYFSLSAKGSQASLDGDTLEWAALLRSVNAIDMYRKQYHHFSHKNVASFLLLDCKIPRSIAHCINNAAQSLSVILGGDSAQLSTQSKMQALQSSLEDIDIEHLLLSGLHEFIDSFQYKLNLVDEAISDSFFSSKEQALASSSQ